MTDDEQQLHEIVCGWRLLPERKRWCLYYQVYRFLVRLRERMPLYNPALERRGRPRGRRLKE